MTDVLVALSGLTDEPELVRSADQVGLRIVRRCVDAVDLLAAAAVAPDCPVVVSAGLPRFTPDAVARLGDRVLVGVASDALGAERLRRMGVDQVIAVAPAPQSTMRQVADVCAAGLSRSRVNPARDADLSRATSSGRDADLSRATSSGRDADPDSGPHIRPGAPVPALESRRNGRLVAVWGPLGAPGRTTVALGVSERWAEEGRRVCLIDADTYGPSVTLALGLVEDASGLIVACRHAEAGPLASTTLESLTMRIPVSGSGEWRVLGGIPEAGRWRDLRRASVDRVWQAAREAFDVTVIDIGFCLESDEDRGTWSQERNAVALSALAEADHVLVVGDASVLGAARLAGSSARLRQVAPTAGVSLIRNRAHGSGREWLRPLAEVLPGASVVEVPEDPRVLRGCWAHARSLGEGARRSRIRRAMGEVAASAVSG